MPVMNLAAACSKPLEEAGYEILAYVVNAGLNQVGPLGNTWDEVISTMIHKPGPYIVKHM